MKILCQYCNIEFQKPVCHIRRTNRHFCSRQCRNLADTIKTKVLCKVCNKEFEVRPSEKSKYTTCSKECQRKSRANQSNPNWKGGTWKFTAKERRVLMAQTEYKTWRKTIFERDDYTCQLCYKRGGNLEADHIKSWALYPELRYNIDNGRTLCLQCHRKTFTGKQNGIHSS